MGRPMRSARPALEVIVHAGVFLHHFLAEPFQLGIGRSLGAQLAERQLGKTAFASSRGEKSIVTAARPRACVLVST